MDYIRMNNIGWTRSMVLDAVDSNYSALRDAVVDIHDMQTNDEQNTMATSELNGMGFNRADAEFGSSIALQILAGHILSERQLITCRKMMHKYASQVAVI